MNQENNNHRDFDDEEIDLRDLIKTLVKWKNTIIGVTVFAMLLSGVISFFVLEPVYEAKTDLMETTVQSFDLNSTGPYYIFKDEEDFRKIEEKAVSLQSPKIGLSNYNELIYSTQILKNTIEKLGLDYKPRNLRSMIKAEQPKDRANVAIHVSHTDPEIAADIANTLAEELIVYIKEMEKSNADKVLQTLTEQEMQAQNDLEQAVENLKDYQANTLLSTQEQSQQIKEQIEIKKLENEVNRREDLVDLFNTKILEFKIMQAFTYTTDNIIILSPAYAPENPVKPNKALNIAIAAVLGLMLATFAAFFTEYMRQEQ